MILLPLLAAAATPQIWARGDLARPQPPIVDPRHPTLGRSAPHDAVRLFDGHSLDAWVVDPDDGWSVIDGILETDGKTESYLRTKASFGDAELHLEFAVPRDPSGEGQHRGNSGVFLMGVYEIQIMDPINNPTYADGLIGAVYGQTPPKVVAAAQPGVWQSYDICFRAPRFKGDRIVSPPIVTARLNGVLVQDQTIILGETSNWGQPTYMQRASLAPLALQNHGDPGSRDRFRNIWIRPLATLDRSCQKPTSKRRQRRK